MAYIQTNKNQNWLLPMSIKDIMYDGAGHPAYHPGIIMEILTQGMLSRVRSSRKLAASCRENFVMMYLAEKTNPDFRTIAIQLEKDYC